MPTKTLDEILEHYGVPGMKWGVRRSEAQLAKARANRKKAEDKERSAEEKVASKSGSSSDSGKSSSKKAKPSEMSDEELRTALNRMNMERQYTQMTASPPSRMSQAKKIAGEIALNSSKQVLTEVAKSHMMTRVAPYMAKPVTEAQRGTKLKKD